MILWASTSSTSSCTFCTFQIIPLTRKAVLLALKFCVNLLKDSCFASGVILWVQACPCFDAIEQNNKKGSSTFLILFIAWEDMSATSLQSEYVIFLLIFGAVRRQHSQPSHYLYLHVLQEDYVVTRLPHTLIKQPKCAQLLFRSKFLLSFDHSFHVVDQEFCYFDLDGGISALSYEFCPVGVVSCFLKNTLMYLHSERVLFGGIS